MSAGEDAADTREGESTSAEVQEPAAVASALRFDIVTIFPGMIAPTLREGVVARGIDAGVIDVALHDLRDFTTDRHRVVDDTPFGGGPGMVMKPEPFFRALAHIRATRGAPAAVVLPSPQGRPFSHAEALALRDRRHIVVLCGRYEGIDDRVREALATDEISIGDYVLSGGELAAMVMLDAVARLVPGVVGDERSVQEDSFATALLDHPHYTRPAEFEGRKVPAVLLSGHHAEIERWRRREALRQTLLRRPDLLETAPLDAEQRAMLRTLREAREEREQDHERH